MSTLLPQRPLRGSRISSFYPVKNLPSLSSLDSAFQLQEYISLLIRLDVHDVEAIISLPGKSAGKEKEKEKEDSDLDSKEKDVEGDEATMGPTEPESGDDAEDKGKSEITVDKACWIYEQLRRLAQDLTHPLITMLQQECTRQTCPTMKAGEWLYLCVAHGNEPSTVDPCCAIDYILHTLDSATALLNTPRAFPSRLQIPQTSHRHFASLARRLGRIFAHAYFHHREAFEQAEAESSLYARFLALTSRFDLVPPEFLVIPSRAEPEEGDSDDVQPPRLLAAAVDPRHDFGLQTQDIGVGQGHWERRGSVVPPERTKSNSPPGLGNSPSGNGNESPRKIGRNRTDTMVLNPLEAYTIAEELTKDRESGGPSARGIPAPVKVDEIENLDEPLLSPMDVGDFPRTAKPRPDELHGNSLPESPTISSPGAPPAPYLPVDPEEIPSAETKTEPTSEVAEPAKDETNVPTATGVATATLLESAEPVSSAPVSSTIDPEPEKPSPDPIEADISEAVEAEAPPSIPISLEPADTSVKEAPVLEEKEQALEKEEEKPTPEEEERPATEKEESPAPVEEEKPASKEEEQPLRKDESTPGKEVTLERDEAPIVEVEAEGGVQVALPPAEPIVEEVAVGHEEQIPVEVKEIAADPTEASPALAPVPATTTETVEESGYNASEVASAEASAEPEAKDVNAPGVTEQKLESLSTQEPSGLEATSQP